MIQKKIAIFAWRLRTHTLGWLSLCLSKEQQAGVALPWLMTACVCFWGRAEGQTWERRAPAYTACPRAWWRQSLTSGRQSDPCRRAYEGTLCQWCAEEHEHVKEVSGRYVQVNEAGVPRFLQLLMPRSFNDSLAAYLWPRLANITEVNKVEVNSLSHLPSAVFSLSYTVTHRNISH